MIQSGKISLILDIKSQVVRDLSTVNDPLAFSIVKTITDGTGANQAQKVWSDRRTLTGTTPENIDINAFGGVPSSVGEVFNLTKINAFVVSNRSTTATLTVGNAGSNEWTQLAEAIVIPPGGVLFLYAAAGFTAVASTNCLVKFLPSATLDYDVVVVGS